LCRCSYIRELGVTTAASSVLGGRAVGPGCTEGAAACLAGLGVDVFGAKARLWLCYDGLLNAVPGSTGVVFDGHVIWAIVWVALADLVSHGLVRIGTRW
jgi:hypothetical protein